MLTRGFLEYAQHRGFIPDPARKGHPQDKPKVERKVPYARERFFKGAEFDDFTHVRAAAPKWCLEVAGMRIHGTTHKKPLVVFQDEERHTLIPWDGIPYEIAQWRPHTVHPDFHIHCLDALYSVPYRALPAGPEGGGQGGQQAGAHLPPWSAHQDPSAPAQGRPLHRHRRLPTQDRFPYTTRAPDRLKRDAIKLGPAVGEFAQRLFEGDHPWSKIRQGHKLLGLGDRYTAQRLDAACQRALDVDLIDVYRVERILVQALEEETTPQLPLPLPTGRFARPGCVFAQSDPYRRKSA